MLYNDYRVAFVAKVAERVKEFVVVPLMQADGGLVEDINHVHEARSDLRGEPYALAFTAAERAGCTVEREVLQAHVDQEAHAVAEFLEDVARDCCRTAGKAEPGEPALQLRNLHGGDLGDSLARDTETVRFGPQTAAAADGAGNGFVDIVQHAGPGDHLRLGALPYPEELVGTVDEKVHGFLRKFGDGFVKRETVFAGDGLHHVELAVVAAIAKRGDTAVGYALAGVGNDILHGHVGHRTQALAVGAVAFGRVEREGMRLRFLDGETRFRVDQMLGEVPEFAGRRVEHRKRALAHAKSCHDRISNALVVALARAEFIDYELDEMGLVAVQLLHVIQAEKFAVDTDLGVALAAHLLEEFAVMALAAAHQGRQQQALPAGVVPHYEIHDLGVGVAHQFLAGDGRICGGCLGEEQAQEIGNFSDGADRTPRVVAGGFLLNGDDGAQAVHTLHFGLFKYAHEVLGIGRQGVHVAALALRIDGVEGKGTLATPAEAGNHRELPAGDVYVDPLQVVSPCPANLYVLLFSHLTNVRK